ncbi:MAG: hypothetical protein DSY84_04670 [Candidatus Neomarinimicrobiota bacterium]|nr:MAG: hypothetical protein DSY84_04670 [Candidatus Neomarinimicrobiota bacterium]
MDRAEYEAVLGGHEHQLPKGERAIIPLVAQDQRATKIAFGYIRDYLARSPMLMSEVEVTSEPFSKAAICFSKLSTIRFKRTVSTM